MSPTPAIHRLIERCRADEAIRDVVLTTEEEGVALAAGRSRAAAAFGC